MRRLPFLALPLLLLVSATVSRREDNPAAPIRSQPIALDRDRPGPLRVGGLRFLQGWTLSSANVAFGGLSSMMADDAGRFVAISDASTVFRFRIGANGIVGPTRIDPLPGREPSKFDNDAESMTIDPVTGTLWVGFEQKNRIRRYDRGITRVTGSVRPPAMRDWPENLGPEAMVRLADGRFVVLSEAASAPGGGNQALIFSGDPTDRATRVTRFRYQPPDRDYRPTDIRQLPDGRLLVLHRRMTMRDGLSAMLTLVDPRRIRPGALVGGRVLARLGWPLEIDNMEALAITREAGRTILWIASDDNFLPIQKTLLLKFALEA